jgi:hypothetical protein
MIDFFKRLFGFSAKPVEAAPANITAPYKVPEPAATTPIPLVVESTAPVKAAPKPKAPAKPKAAATKPKAPAKTPAKPKIKVVK